MICLKGILEPADTPDLNTNWWLEALTKFFTVDCPGFYKNPELADSFFLYSGTKMQLVAGEGIKPMPVVIIEVLALNHIQAKKTKTRIDQGISMIVINNDAVSYPKIQWFYYEVAQWL